MRCIYRTPIHLSFDAQFKIQYLSEFQTQVNVVHTLPRLKDIVWNYWVFVIELKQLYVKKLCKKDIFLL